MLIGAKTDTQQISERGHQTVGSRHVRMHQGRDGVECIEQEMRPQLTLKLCKLRLGQRFLRLQQTAPLELPLSIGIDTKQNPEPQSREICQLEALIHNDEAPA